MNRWAGSLSIVVAMAATLVVMLVTPEKHNPDKTAMDRSVKVFSKVKDSSSQGTGTLMPNGFVLTCAHLFPERGKFMPLVLQRGETNPKKAKIIRIDHKRDLALLRFEGAKSVKPLKINPFWAYGQDLFFIGNGVDDFMLGHSKFSGLVITSYSHGPVLMYPCDKGQPGFSGGGVFNAKGELLGVFELGFFNEDRCGAIRAEEVIEWLKEIK